jgi:hypothetical protein
MGQASGSQPSTLAGSDDRGQYDDTGPDLQAGFETLPMVWSRSTSARTEHHGHSGSLKKVDTEKSIEVVGLVRT